MSATVTLSIADDASPDELKGKVLYRYTDESGVGSAQAPAPDAIQDVLKSLFSTGEIVALDEAQADAEAKALELERRRTELQARLSR